MRYSSRRAFSDKFCGPLPRALSYWAGAHSRRTHLSESMPSRCDSELMHSVSSDYRGEVFSLTGSVGSPIPKRIWQGRQYVIDLMRAAGLEPRVDPAGNIFGRRAGTDEALPPILFGSHVDSVPNGGNFDGYRACSRRSACSRRLA